MNDRKDLLQVKMSAESLTSYNEKSHLKFTQDNNDYENDEEREAKNNCLTKTDSSGPLSPISGVTQIDNPPSSTSPIFRSPMPIISFSPTDKSLLLRRFKERKTLEELVDSEQTYVASMTMLLNFYIEPLHITYESEVAQPFKFFELYITQLVAIHSKLLRDMRSKLAGGKIIDDVTVELAQLVASTGVNTYLYEEYCNIYEDVLNFVKGNNLNQNMLNLNNHWIKAWEHYLDATQTSTIRMDLSFISLAQRPISRIGKYRLIVEAMLKHAAKSKHEELNSCLSSLKAKLSTINDKSQKSKESDISVKINEMLIFDDIQYQFGLCLQFFGKPLLIGSLVGIWVESKHQKSTTFGCFLFKSHFVLCDMNEKKFKKFIVKFIIPLASCKILKNSEEIMDGLQSSFPYLFKIIFEHKMCHYEILLLAITRAEQDIWYDSLNVLINFVNGPYELDFSKNDSQQLITYPSFMSPYDAHSSISQEVRISCYYRHHIAIYVLVNFYNQRLKDLNHKNSSTCTNLPYRSQANNSEILVILKKNERIFAEFELLEVWSKEVPLIFHEIGKAPHRKPSLRKSASWTTIRMGTLKSLRYSNSFNEVLNNSDRIFNNGSDIVIKATHEKLKPTSTFNERKLLQKSITLPDLRRINIEDADKIESHEEHFKIHRSRSNRVKSALFGFFHPAEAQVRESVAK
ncbi:uncharacterized protein PRCAT00001647001 [Priceomyces carsonii]|uniref:uncharacterized protein n=1 Tax=Priceomyces carsonii TaxID=28549 RepID=UPI002ED8DF3F|nr:unnamed protein product [Priceomyces carsonii]